MRNSPIIVVLLCLLFLPSIARAEATIVIVSTDGPNVGFNDPTPATPVGGNTGTTLGQQRLNAVTAAANQWGATLVSNVLTSVNVTWADMTCSENSGVLGTAGTSNIWRDFANAPLDGHWYGSALANKLAGVDLNPSSAEINLNLNQKVGQPGCLTGAFFYLGLDNNHGNRPDLYGVVLHELGHGLGFQSYTQGSTGNFVGGFPSIWDEFLFDNVTNKKWVDMTVQERVASAINTGHLVWTGPRVTAAIPLVLQGGGGSYAGADSQGRALMYAPNPYQSGSSVSHFDTTMTPNQVMEPSDGPGLRHSISEPADLTLSLLEDIGWAAGGDPQSDLNGDGKSDILWQHTNGSSAVWLMNGLSMSSGVGLLGPGTGWSVKTVGDFNDDGKTDITWQHTDGSVAIWLMNGLSMTSGAGLLGPGTGWSVKTVGDFNGDGKTDIAWQHTDGSAAIWLMNGLALSSGATVLGPATGWTLKVVGDFNGDGKTDIVWQHTDGRTSAWLMNGLSVTSGVGWLGPATGWSLKTVGDFNDDGKTDVVWQHTDGSTSAWLMNGLSATSGVGLLGPGTGWSVKTVGDFNGDGKSDIAWQHTDGSTSAWLMNGLTATGSAGWLGPATGWTIQQILDLNGDGKSDILWLHSNGSSAAWLMNGLSLSSGGGFLGPATGWSPVP